MLHCICINLEMKIPVPYVLLCCSASMETRNTCILCFRMQVPLSVWGFFVGVSFVALVCLVCFFDLSGFLWVVLLFFCLFKIVII